MSFSYEASATLTWHMYERRGHMLMPGFVTNKALACWQWGRKNKSINRENVVSFTLFPLHDTSEFYSK